MSASPNWLSFIASPNEALVVSASVPSEGPLQVSGVETWPLDPGERPQAYAALRRRIQAYLSAQAISFVAYRGAASSQFGTGPQAYLAAEIRGALLSALGEGCVRSRAFTKGVVSRRFGTQKVGDYLRDDGFWRANCIGDIPRSHREAAFYLFVARGENRPSESFGVVS